MTDIKSDNTKPRQVSVNLLITPQIRKSDAPNVTGICNVCGKAFFDVLTEKKKEEHINSHSDTEVINMMLKHCLNENVKCVHIGSAFPRGLAEEIWGNEEDDVWDKEDPYIIKGDDDISNDIKDSLTKSKQKDDDWDDDYFDQELEDGLYEEHRQWQGKD